MRRWLAAAALGVAASACAPAPLRLPQGTGRPVADVAPIVAGALGHCEGLHSITAEAGLSGRAGGRRLRGRLILGIEIPERIRLEAVAPFGPPVFILAAREDDSALLLPRDDRVLTDAAPQDVLAALAGVSLTPADLAALIAGCVPGGLPAQARAIGDDWIVLGAPTDSRQVYLRRHDAVWRLAALERPDLIAAFEHSTGTQPSSVRLQSREGGPGHAFDLALQLSQVEVNPAIPLDAFTVKLPDSVMPITLEELRQAGPMRDRARGDGER